LELPIKVASVPITNHKCLIIIEKAQNSAQIALTNALDYLENNRKEKIIPIGFDCSWSHVRNANRASGEFLCR